MFNNNAENQKLFLIFGQCGNISKNQRQLKVITKTLDYILRSKIKMTWHQAQNILTLHKCYIKNCSTDCWSLLDLAELARNLVIRRK